MTEAEQTSTLSVTLPESPSLTDAFHRINVVIPDDQELRCVTPGTPVSEAIQVMRQHKYSQLPIKQGQYVVGVLSFRSIATRAIELGNESVDLGRLPVEEFVEDLDYTHIRQEFPKVFPALDRDNAILVGQPNQLQAIVTPMDIVRHLHKTARPFVLIAEIERTLRNLIRTCVDEDQLQQCINLTLTHYRPGRRPATLEDTSFYDLIQIIGSEETWPKFQHAFGGIVEWQRLSTVTTLTEVRLLRNDVFHFKRELQEEDYYKLAECRRWLKRRAEILEAQIGGG